MHFEHAVRHLRRADPVLGRLIRDIGPCRLAVDGRQSAFAALAESIVYQEITGKAAASIYRKLCAAAGRRQPRPEDILSLSGGALRAVGLSSQKVRSLRDLAAHAPQISMRRLARLPDEEVIAQLTQVRGIGRWTAEMFLIFRLGRLDVMPVDDHGVRKAIQRAYGLPELPKANAMRELARPWRPYRSVASWYLWRSLGGAAGRAT
jgi:DNA-3-methyladenine glycosylase II